MRGWLIGAMGVAFLLGDGRLRGAVPGDSTQRATGDKGPSIRLNAGEIIGTLVGVDAAQQQLRIRIALPFLRNGRWDSQQQEVELEMAEDCKVRLRRLPPKYDERGNPKAYSSAERRALHDPGLPGYRGDFDSLKPGQTLRLDLVKPKPPGRSAPGPRTGQPDPKPLVRLVLILAEPAR